MPSAYRVLLNTVKRVPGLQWVASRLVFLLPDRVVERDVDQLGLFAFRLRRHRWMLGKPLFVSGHHAQTLAMFRQLIRPGDVVYDIGANIGYYTRFIARDMGAGQVISFEPMTENAELLERNVALAKLDDKVKVYRLALSDHTGDELLQVDDVMGGTAVLDAVAGGKPSEARQHVGLGPKTETVKVMTLDSLIQRDNLPAPAFIKIDTEGAEAMVLGGALNTLRTHKPRLAIALHGEGPTRAVLNLLMRLGYTCRGEVDGVVRTLTPDDAGRLSDNNITAVAE
jgi:FkbM family methyltransferase